MNQIRTYFIRTRNRSRILETLVCQIVKGVPGNESARLVFGIARAPRTESSPSRKSGRQAAMKRLEEAIVAYGEGEKFVYRRPHLKRDAVSGVSHDPINIMGGTLKVGEVVPVLYDLLIGGWAFAFAQLVPSWAWNQDEDCLAHFPEYHDMLCKLRNQVEMGSF